MATASSTSLACFHLLPKLPIGEATKESAEICFFGHLPKRPIGRDQQKSGSFDHLPKRPIGEAAKKSAGQVSFSELGYGCRTMILASIRPLQHGSGGGLPTDASPPSTTAAAVADVSRPLSAPNGDDAKHGFSRAEMYKVTLAGTVQLYERHVFLCFKEAQSWPPRVEAQSWQVEASGFDRLPRLLAASLNARKNDMPKKTRLTICEGRDGTDSSNGDVLIFPDMVRYKGLTHFDVETFVDEVLVQNREWPSGRPEKLEGNHVFVCAHGSRDVRCGVTGPPLIGKFKDEISLRGLDGHVFVRPCSHIGGHKYAGNVIIYGSSAAGEVAGHWYGYVTPDDVPILLDEHISKGKIIDRLWRGQMGLIEADQKQAHQNRLQAEKEGCFCSRNHEQTNGQSNGKISSSLGCCQENADSADGGRAKNKENGEDKTVHGSGVGSTWSRFLRLLRDGKGGIH